MAINKKLIHFKKYSDFIGNSGINGVTLPTNGYYHNIPENSIVFIQDELKIWTHGKLYDCGETDLSDYLPADEIAEMYATIEALNGKLDASLKLTDKAASIWVSDSTYADYPYRCDIACAGVTASMYAEVAFSMEQATSGDYAPVCETKANVVSIWSKVNTSIAIPNIIITK